jgi:release factor glutamine methyltransferase
MRSIEELLRLSTKFLESRGFERARREAEELLSHALEMRRLDLYLQFDRPLESGQVDRCREALRRRAEGEPSQYIAGWVDFFDCRIAVGPGVLIPRPETEQLVDRVSKEISTGKLLDLCCGSGCIGIALAKRHPDLEVTLVDISPIAVEYVQKNAQSNGVEVEILSGDLTGPVEGRQFDWVVCNPPYIAEEEYARLQREVRDWEPITALVSGATGLEFYHRLNRELPGVMRAGGKAWFEIGSSQGEEVAKIFSQLPWCRTEVTSDWAGRNRFFSLEIEASKQYPSPQTN